jgi:lambda repressor-like predicted transcriptional regulator
MTRDKRTAQRAAILKEFHDSGLTQAAFCKQRGIALSTLRYWLGRERKKSWAQRPMNMVAIGSVPTRNGSGMLRVVASGGITIEIERPVSESELVTILKAIVAS